MRQPHGAAELIRVRLAGKVPADPVAVCDMPDVARLFQSLGIFAVLAGPGAWDMRCLHGLAVVAYLAYDDVLGVVESIAEAAPSAFALVGRRDLIAFIRVAKEGGL